MLASSSLHDTNIAALLARQARRHGRRTFLKLREGEIAFDALHRSVVRLASGLSACGVRAGDHVAVMLPNCEQFVQLVFATAHLGAVFVPINTAYRGAILKHVLATSDAGTLVVDEIFLDQLQGQYEDLERLSCVIVRGGRDGVPRGLARSTLNLSKLYRRAAEAPSPESTPDALQAIMFTSGTTGLSKGVMVPHTLALESARTFLSLIAHEDGETVYCPLPLFHASGMWEGLMAPLLAGSPLALVERFSASRFWSDARHFNARIAMGVFSMAPILLKRSPSSDDRSHPLRAFYTGKSLHDAEFTQRFGVRCVENYASTEAGIPIASPYGEWAPGACGRPWSETHEVALVDRWDRPLPPGEVGEIVVRPRLPFTVTPGYYRNAQATAQSFRNLWFHTGDLARRDADDHYFVFGRIKDCIRRRGENISAFEVEQGVNSHPAVLESAAIAAPSEFEEDEIKIVVVARPGMDLDPADLIEHCTATLPGFMTPRYVEVVDELPRNAVGKVAKQELRNHGITAATWERPGAARASVGVTERRSACGQSQSSDQENSA